ncbi:MAG: IclR family transcriptional regulator [Eubacteriales bacterium]
MQVVEKITEIIALMSSDPTKKYWRGTEISQQLNINVSTTHRLLQSLKNSGFVYQDMETKKYTLGMNLIYYAEMVREMNIPGIIIHPLMQRLHEAFGETVFITIKEGDSCIVIERINSYHQLRLVKQIGETKLLHEGPCGKVILAYLPDEISHRIIHTSSNKEYLISTIKEIQENGYLIEYYDHIDCTIISAPVITPQNYIIASISVAVPRCRMTSNLSEKIVTLLKEVSSKYRNGCYT